MQKKSQLLDKRFAGAMSNEHEIVKIDDDQKNRKELRKLCKLLELSTNDADVDMRTKLMILYYKYLWELNRSQVWIDLPLVTERNVAERRKNTSLAIQS